MSLIPPNSPTRLDEEAANNGKAKGGNLDDAAKDISLSTDVLLLGSKEAIILDVQANLDDEVIDIDDEVKCYVSNDADPSGSVEVPIPWVTIFVSGRSVLVETFRNYVLWLAAGVQEMQSQKQTQQLSCTSKVEVVFIAFPIWLDVIWMKMEAIGRLISSTSVALAALEKQAENRLFKGKCASNEPVKTKLALMGKRLTFDNSRYNISTGLECYVELMEFDMGGSAAVIGAVDTIVHFQLPGVVIHFIIAGCENMISGTACFREGLTLKL